MKIGIVGLGLIGGSLGLDFRRLGHQVLGVARRSETCDQAIAAGAVDQATTTLARLEAVEVVIICTPIAMIEPTVKEIAPHLAADAVITDVGSVKGAIAAAATQHWPRFVGGHPMAGKSEAGLAAAEAHLFRDRAYVITPLPQTPADAVETVQTLATDLGARVFTCDPTVHDRAVAWISHLPVMVSSSLIQACLHEPDEQVRYLAQQFASSGFRDTSRVGGGNPELGMMMARYNQAEVLRSLQTYREELDHLIHQLQEKDWAAIEHTLTENQAARPSFL